MPFTEPTFNIEYHLSNADTSIYLDAKKILKENAYPKVAYEIEVSKWSPDLLTSIYTKLAQIVMINDTDLKLQNTFGYISNVKLDLDHEEKDSVEVKNYKTKFEDLFSRIVAETEEMHKNSRNLSLAGALVGGQGGSDVPLSKKGMEDTLSDPSIQDMLQDFMKKYFDGAEVVQKKLQELWNEAGAILGSAAISLNSVMGLTTENASILAGFRENVLAAMTPKIFTGSTPPTEFKPGDIWINDEQGYRSVATGYGSRGGFTRTYDGKLAEISGSSFGINADTGEIDIINETNINLMSGKTIYIAAGDNVDIVGNESVNIGGTTINIASAFVKDTNGNIVDGNNTSDKKGGIHLVSTIYKEDLSLSDEDMATSTVDVEGSGITMASKNGIIIKSGAGIDIKSSNNEDVSAIQIDKDKGIYLGSTQKISLFSGDISDLEHPIGASAELSKDHLLLGIANIGEANATALEMTTQQIIIAAGDHLDLLPKNNKGELIIADIVNTTVTDSNNNTYNLTGVQIKSDYIGMATGKGNNRTIFSMTPKLIQLGQMTLKQKENGTYYSGNKPEHYSGSYLWLAKDEIYIGSMGHFTLNTNNIKIQTRTIEDGNNTFGFALGTNLQDTSNPGAKLGFAVSGNTATLMVDGNITAQQFTGISSNGYFIANGNSFGLYKTDGTSGILTITNDGKISAAEDLTIAASKTLTLTGASLIMNTTTSSGGVIQITSSNFIVNSSATAKNSKIFYVKADDNNYINLYNSDTSTPALKIKVAAANLIIGSQDIGTYAAAQITDDRIWLGVTNKANGSSGLTITSSGITISTDGTFSVTAQGGNFVINSSTPKLLIADADTWSNATKGIIYTSSGGLKIKGEITATSGTIGTWTIGETSLSKQSTANNNSGTMTLNYYYSTEQKYYAINAGNNFWVDYAGNVWIYSLKVKDGDTWKTIDFSQDFKSAISFNTNGSGWDGNNLTVNLKLWGSLSKEVNLTAKAVPLSVTVDTINSPSDASKGTGKVRMKRTFEGAETEYDSQTVTINAAPCYNQGWKNGYNDAISAAGVGNGGTVYTGGTYWGLSVYDETGRLLGSSALINPVSHTLQKQ